MHILVAGGGISGLTLALAAHKAGHDVELYEQAGALTEIGAGIQLSPNAMRVFDWLGVSSAIEHRAFRPRAMELRLGKSGTQIFSLPLREAAVQRWGAQYLHVHRADLISVLKDALEARVPGSLHLGRRVADVITGGEEGAPALVFDDGTRADGDLVVGADGIHSQVRCVLFGPDAPRFTGHVAWRCTVPLAALGADVAPETACVWTGTRRHAVTYRLRGGSLVNFVGVVEQPSLSAREESWVSQGERAEALNDFRGWHPTILGILTAAEKLNIWALHDRPPLRAWVKGRAVLIGDACHPMVPFLAQGAAMGIEDAFVLVKELGRHARLSDALAAYVGARRPRTAAVQAAAERNGRLYHGTDPVSRTGAIAGLWMLGQILPGVIRAQTDWIYAYDAAH